MCDAEKDWHERSFRASGAFGRLQSTFQQTGNLIFFLYFLASRALIKMFFHSPGSQLKMFMSACILVNLLHSKLAKNELNLRVSNACSCRKT